MNEQIQFLVLGLPALWLFAVGILSGINKGQSPKALIRLSNLAISASILVSAWGGFLVYQNGLMESDLIGWNGLGFSLRWDALSAVMLAMISVIGFVVMRYSFNYLDGDDRHGLFIGRLSTTIASVQLLVMSGNLFMFFVAWVATSLSLHQLLLFYSDRKKAVVAATKKFIIARLGDLCLLLAIFLIYLELGIGDMQLFFTYLQLSNNAPLPITLELAAVLLVATAILKSVQIPFHGWLIEVMESPTPVSALLHAGLLNAGPFLMIRFSYLLENAQIAPMILFVIGALSALYGSIVYITQPSIKTALGYSSIAHMGFTMMVCGMGVYSAAMLHLVAHSFYKAHAFLSSGSVVDHLRTKNATSYHREGNLWKILAGLIVTTSVFGVLVWLIGLDINHEFQMVNIAGIILMGLANYLTAAVDSGSFKTSLFKLAGLGIIVILCFFLFESLMRYVLGSQLPELTPLSGNMLVLCSITIGLFFLVVLSQIFYPVSKWGDFMRKTGIHLRNGLYLNMYFDRLIGSLNEKK